MTHGIVVLDAEVRALEIECDEGEKTCVELGDTIADIQEVNQSKKRRIADLKRSIEILKATNHSAGTTTIVADESCEVYED
ncbi:hypothetical protein KAR91_10995 [Candidatus Pacearchaeota archaeon]|nr:hypothetical protein [Candidatus Pacearchaeota archaeon]